MILKPNLLIIASYLLLNVSGRPVRSVSDDLVGSLTNLVPVTNESSHKKLAALDEFEVVPAVKGSSSKQSQLSDDDDDSGDSKVSSKENLKDEERVVSDTKEDPKPRRLGDKKATAAPKGGFKKHKSSSDIPKEVEKSDHSAGLHKKPTTPAKSDGGESGEVDYIGQLTQLTNLVNGFLESGNFKSLATGMIKEKLDKVMNEEAGVYLEVVKNKIDSFIPSAVEGAQNHLEVLELGAFAGLAGKLLKMF